MWSWMRRFFRGRTIGFPEISIDEVGVRRELGEGRCERVKWSELTKVEIFTTDEGPWWDDVFWVLWSGDEGCVLPNELGTNILEHINHLPGLSTETLIAAMGCTSNGRFLIWELDQTGTSVTHSKEA
jgi:hypothetical protein